MRIKKKRLSIERPIQCSFIEWCRWQPKLRDIVYHIPNGGKRNAIEAAKFKAMGVLRGVCDVCIPLPNSIYHGLYIEFKADNGKLTDYQSKFIDAIEKNGYKAIVCKTAQSAVDAVLEYMAG